MPSVPGCGSASAAFLPAAAFLASWAVLAVLALVAPLRFFASASSSSESLAVWAGRSVLRLRTCANAAIPSVLASSMKRHAHSSRAVPRSSAHFLPWSSACSASCAMRAASASAASSYHAFASGVALARTDALTASISSFDLPSSRMYFHVSSFCSLYRAWCENSLPSWVRASERAHSRRSTLPLRNSIVAASVALRAASSRSVSAKLRTNSMGCDCADSVVDIFLTRTHEHWKRLVRKGPLWPCPDGCGCVCVLG